MAALKSIRGLITLQFHFIAIALSFKRKKIQIQVNTLIIIMPSYLTGRMQESLYQGCKFVLHHVPLGYLRLRI